MRLPFKLDLGSLIKVRPLATGGSFDSRLFAGIRLLCSRCPEHCLAQSERTNKLWVSKLPQLTHKSTKESTKLTNRTTNACKPCTSSYTFYVCVDGSSCLHCWLEPRCVFVCLPVDTDFYYFTVHLSLFVLNDWLGAPETLAAVSTGYAIVSLRLSFQRATV